MKIFKRTLAIFSILVLGYLFISIRKTPIGIGILIPKVLAQAIVQLPCPQNYGPINSLTLRNSATGNIMNWGCFDDRTGNLSIGAFIYVAAVADGPAAGGGTDNTAVIQAALGLGKCLVFPAVNTGFAYSMHTISITGQNCIKGQYRNTILQPLSGNEPLFSCAGPSLAGAFSFIDITDITFNEPFTPTVNTGIAIKSVYCNDIRIEHNVFNNWWSGWWSDNSNNIYIQNNVMTGAKVSGYNIYIQRTDTTHGPYYGQVANILNNRLDSSSSCTASVWIQDHTSVHFNFNDIIGNKCKGIHFDSLNAGNDKPSDINVEQNTFDTDDDIGIDINNIRDSSIISNWTSTGRTNTTPCINITNSDTVKLQSNHIFWCGTHGINAPSGDTTLVIEGNTCNAVGSICYRLIGVSASTIENNQARIHVYNGLGSAAGTQAYTDDATSSNNTWIGNLASDFPTFFNLQGTNDIFLNQGGAGNSGAANIPRFFGVLTTTAAASDNFSVTNMTSSGHCQAQATNATAAALTGVFCTTGSSIVTVTHSATANGTFNIFATYQ